MPRMTLETPDYFITSEQKNFRVLVLVILIWINSSKSSSPDQPVPLVSFEIIDEVKPGHTIGNIRQVLWQKSSTVFSLVVVTSSNFQRFNEYFSITKNGTVIVQKLVDRDNLDDVCGPLDCCQSAVCTIDARVMFIVDQNEDSSVSSNDQLPAHLQLRLVDVNDNSPQFPLNSNGRPEFTVRIQEGGKFARETLPSAVDLDSAENGIVQYRLSSDKNPNHSTDELFRLSYEKVLSDPLNKSQGWRLSPPMLIQLRELDFEVPTDRQFKLIVIAIDGGNPALTGSLSVTVNLMDINDNSPIFEKTNVSTIELAENTTFSPNPIHKFIATDLDSGENGLISYSLSPLNEPRVFDKFSIDNSNGALYLISALDYEVYSERHFTVIAVASDNGTPKRSGTTTLTVVTRDINDNLPTLVVQENITVIEGINYTKPVVRFYVKDDDFVSRGKVTCRPSPSRATEAGIAAGAASLRLQEVTANAYFVFTEGIFDYEETKSASVEIVCSDRALGEPLTSPDRPIRITVAIGDANDHYPEFGVSEFLTKLPEHSPEGTRIARLTATDADSGLNSRVTYSLVNDNGGRCSTLEALSIDRQTGVVSVKNGNCLDREANEEVEAFVAAEDGGGLSTSVKLKIRLMDVNDNEPRFQVTDSFSVPENRPGGFVIGSVRCTDADVGVNSGILLELSENNTQSVKESFDLLLSEGLSPNVVPGRGKVSGRGEVSAVLVTKKRLDREEVETYTIQLVATDMGEPPLRAHKTIHLVVLDENDNQPIPRFPQPFTTVGYHPLVHTNSPYGSKVCVLRSHDPDRGENGTVVYDIQPGTNGSRDFHLDRVTGALTTMWHQKGPTPGVYAIKVLLYDMGQNATKVEWNFFVYISPRNPHLDSTSSIKTRFSGGPNTTLAVGSKSWGRLSQIASIMIIIAVAVAIVLVISCACMIKLLVRSKSKSHPPSGTPKSGSSALYSPSTLGMVYTQSPTINNALSPDTPKYNLSTPEHVNWCMRPVEMIGQSDGHVPPLEGTTGNGYYFTSPPYGTDTMSRCGCTTLWQGLPPT
uniref:Protocadherin n=1 Tax=Mesocestoides corti TaxID=53468 RepID=A0A5K3F286_MESCO